ncbi:hypothetical protein EVAR_43502_1 [Eumeta japonica]|uniref:Uncharacterized protein n=1 Tax=Eumeta variegata TaxID=151549 RepID=A0A4C1YHF3_EUMVA|nr:hypothetical protein EVAR_43502_1 [Eumeta japonica]
MRAHTNIKINTTKFAHSDIKIATTMLSLEAPDQNNTFYERRVRRARASAASEARRSRLDELQVATSSDIASFTSDSSILFLEREINSDLAERPHDRTASLLI